MGEGDAMKLNNETQKLQVELDNLVGRFGMRGVLNSLANVLHTRAVEGIPTFLSRDTWEDELIEIHSDDLETAAKSLKNSMF